MNKLIGKDTGRHIVFLSVIENYFNQIVNFQMGFPRNSKFRFFFGYLKGKENYTEKHRGDTERFSTTEHWIRIISCQVETPDTILSNAVGCFHPTVYYSASKRQVVFCVVQSCQ